MPKDGYYVMSVLWAKTCLKEAKTEEDALWMIDGWAKGLAEDAFKMYKHMLEQENVSKNEKQANTEH